MKYLYGMRLRPAGPMCQPKGFNEIRESNTYHDILVYEFKLSDKDLHNYDLDYIGEEND